MRSLVLIIILLLSFAGCKTKSIQKEIVLSSGNKIIVLFEKTSIDGKQQILAVDYKTDEQKIKVAEVEKEVLDIWNGVKREAELMGLDEALIRYSFYDGEKTKEGRNNYRLLVFEAIRAENGRWSVRRIY